MVTGICLTVPRPKESRFLCWANSLSSRFSSSLRLLQYLEIEKKNFKVRELKILFVSQNASQIPPPSLLPALNKVQGRQKKLQPHIQRMAQVCNSQRKKERGVTWIISFLRFFFLLSHSCTLTPSCLYAQSSLRKKEWKRVAWASFWCNHLLGYLNSTQKNKTALHWRWYLEVWNKENTCHRQSHSRTASLFFLKKPAFVIFFCTTIPKSNVVKTLKHSHLVSLSCGGSCCRSCLILCFSPTELT